MIPAFRSTKPAHWVSPRPYNDAARRHVHGPLQGMDEARGGLLDWLIRGLAVAAVAYAIYVWVRP